ncbi:MAG TPA: transcription elongation factor GreA [Bacteriovoracaceae bacterium]|nr:transcription elongation factor GreA [Bacteriovoracaceae bacterium]
MRSPITTVGKKKIEAELNNLIKVERETIKRAIADARAQGDLSENADYQYAKEKQSSIEGRIMQLQGILAQCDEIDVNTIASEKIVFGAYVKLFDEQKNSSVEYQIVGDDEADIATNKISYKSPLGRALIGKEDGDVVTVKAPKGEIEYEIQSFRFK